MPSTSACDLKTLTSIRYNIILPRVPKYLFAINYGTIIYYFDNPIFLGQTVRKPYYYYNNNMT